MKKDWKDRVYLRVINQLILDLKKEKVRTKLKGTEWMMAEDHPRIGEVVVYFPNILKTGSLEK